MKLARTFALLFAIAIPALAAADALTASASCCAPGAACCAGDGCPRCDHAR